MKNNDFLTWLGSFFGSILTAIQTEKVFQIISLILTIIATLTSLIFTFYKWYKKATEDGKITEEEVKELAEKIKDERKDK